jgi:DNA repair protein RecN (Recombination protein N)
LQINFISLDQKSVTSSSLKDQPSMAYKTSSMLRFLRVRHFALIDEMEVHFRDGFNLLSGETGAGKSIMVDALGLLAGSKASSEMIRSGESRAIVEAVFETDLREELDRLGIDADDSQLIVRREISNDDRNRVYINNQPSTLSALRTLAPVLLDIHGQHEQQTLLDNSSQLALIDSFADASELASRVRALHETIQTTQATLLECTAEHARQLERMDFLSFQRDEIEKADPKPEESRRARERLSVLANAGRLLAVATRGYDMLYESETSVLSQLSQLQRSLRDAAQHDSRLHGMLDQVEAARISIQDISRGLRDYTGQLDTDPQEMERLQIRLTELERLHRKYGPDLIEHLEKVRREMDSIGLTETQKDQLQAKIAELRQSYDEAAMTLRKKRRAVSRMLESAVIGELRSLAMPDAEFTIRWTEVPPRASGIDQAELLISTNRGEPLQPVEKVASGGELSRLMLALRTVLAAEGSRKTLIFDEVDSGVGGKAAETIGLKLQQLSSRYQILCVTHLAQIAAFADHQYRIEKVVADGRSVTRVEAMTGEARVEELARMMSGSRVTDAARQHVKELLGKGK